MTTAIEQLAQNIAANNTYYLNSAWQVNELKAYHLFKYESGGHKGGHYDGSTAHHYINDHDDKMNSLEGSIEYLVKELGIDFNIQAYSDLVYNELSNPNVLETTSSSHDYYGNDSEYEMVGISIETLVTLFNKPEEGQEFLQAYEKAANFSLNNIKVQELQNSLFAHIQEKDKEEKKLTNYESIKEQRTKTLMSEKERLIARIAQIDQDLANSKQINERSYKNIEKMVAMWDNRIQETVTQIEALGGVADLSGKKKYRY